MRDGGTELRTKFSNIIDRWGRRVIGWQFETFDGLPDLRIVVIELVLRIEGKHHLEGIS